MPHVTVEYTANLGADARIPELLAAINQAMLAQRHEGKPVYPIGGLRTRAIRLDEYLVADGAASGDDAFVHAMAQRGIRGRALHLVGLGKEDEGPAAETVETTEASASRPSPSCWSAWSSPPAATPRSRC